MSEEHGFFSGNPKTEWLPATQEEPHRGMVLLEDFSYTDPQNKVWTAHKGRIINGADIPRALWVTVGSPFVGSYRNASIVHDTAIKDGEDKQAWKLADDMFYTACLAGGCNRKQANLLYAGVAIGTRTGHLKNVAAELPESKDVLALYKKAEAEILKTGDNLIFSKLKQLMSNLSSTTEKEA